MADELREHCPESPTSAHEPSQLIRPRVSICSYCERQIEQDQGDSVWRSLPDAEDDELESTFTSSGGGDDDDDDDDEGGWATHRESDDLWDVEDDDE
jgi:hypothetical protein